MTAGRRRQTAGQTVKLRTFSVVGGWWSAVILFLLLMAGCASAGQERNYISQAVWSDDDTHFAFVVSRYTERPALNPFDDSLTQENFRFQLYHQALDGSDRRPLSPEIAGQAGPIYYMRQAGYVIAHNLSDHRISQFWLDGRVEQLAQGADLQIIPSPDGQTLAQVQRGPACKAGGQAGTNCQVTVIFLTADTHAQLSREQIGLNGSFGPAEVTWVSKRAFIVTDSVNAYVLGPELALLDTPVPNCIIPKTTSSLFSAQGTLVYAQGDSLRLGSTDPATAFGCQ